MKAALIIVLLCQCLSGYGQLKDDSLKKSLTDQYLLSLTKECDSISSFWGPQHLIFTQMDEVFKGYFKDTQIYFLLFRDSAAFMPHADRYYYPALYAIGASGKKTLQFRNEESFFNFVNTAKGRIANLDKAYLYLYLYLKISQKERFYVTKPQSYGSDIIENSLFANGMFTGIDNIKFAFPDHDNDTKDVSKYSSNKLITMYADFIECATNAKHIKCWYLFHFDDHNKLTSVSTDTLR